VESYKYACPQEAGCLRLLKETLGRVWVNGRQE
jgi:hypothetical protein